MIYAAQYSEFLLRLNLHVGTHVRPSYPPLNHLHLSGSFFFYLWIRQFSYYLREWIASPSNSSIRSLTFLEFGSCKVAQFLRLDPNHPILHEYWRNCLIRQFRFKLKNWVILEAPTHLSFQRIGIYRRHLSSLFHATQTSFSNASPKKEASILYFPGFLSLQHMYITGSSPI